MRCWHIFLLWFFISNRDEFLFLDESVDVNIRKVCFLLVIKNYLIKATNFQKSSFLFITSQTVLDGTLNPFINDIPFSSHDQNYLNISAICDFSFPFLKSRRRNFFILLGLCFFFYPIVPTIGYLINLCYMTGGQDQTSHKIEMFAKVKYIRHYISYTPPEPCFELDPSLPPGYQPVTSP